ncbi:MAG TPA: SDR family oxidoreductase, partial [Burkholderiales bacterium]|nr:SDR family oxidoreductase [Burkholderiales bacterium]
GPQGIRVNGISAGPIKTLAAAGIGGFGKILKFVEEHAPLRRNVTTEDVGNAAAFLLSDLAAAITGEVLYVDAGFSHVVAGIGGAEFEAYLASLKGRADISINTANLEKK